MNLEFKDIRDNPHLRHPDIIGLNFIRHSAPYVFRRHFRQGLRSHVIELLDPADVEREINGTRDGGIRRFPKAVPLAMLRIFRTRFASRADALREIERLKVIETYLLSNQFARSTEFLVDYRRTDGNHLLLCGLQEYVAGEILNPWRIHQPGDLAVLYSQMVPAPRLSPGDWVRMVLRHTASFTQRVKWMTAASGFIPDLAGIGNLILTSTGELKLVDINNISRLRCESRICLDDKGYPVCDKSIEAVARLETRLLGRPPVSADPLYREFLTEPRLRRVKALEKAFFDSLARQVQGEADPGGSSSPESGAPGESV